MKATVVVCFVLCVITLLSSTRFDDSTFVSATQMRHLRKPPRQQHSHHNVEKQKEQEQQVLQEQKQDSDASKEKQHEEPKRHVNKTSISDIAELSKQVQNELNHLQNPKNCQDKNIKFLECNGWYSGLGSRTWFYRQCLSLAYERNKIMIIQDHNDKGYNLVFEPLTSCALSDIEAAKKDQRVEAIDTQTLVDFDIIPDKFKQLGLLWWQVQLTVYLQRPNSETRALITKRKQQFKWPSDSRQVAGMHVRRSDKVATNTTGVSGATEAAAHTFNDYVTRLEQNIKSLPPPKITHLFIMSDDNNLPREFTPALKKRYKIMFSGDKMDNKPVHPWIDNQLLGETRALAFTWSSNFGQMAFNKILFRDNFCSFATSLDQVLGLKYVDNKITTRTYLPNDNIFELNSHPTCPSIPTVKVVEKSAVSSEIQHQPNLAQPISFSCVLPKEKITQCFN